MLLSVFLAGFAASVANAQKDAIAAVYAVMQNDRTSQGTGFFISPNGRLLTAYHVIVNSKKIWVTYKGIYSDNVSVEKISPSHDLVELQVNFRSSTQVPFLKLSTRPLKIQAGEKVKIYGWPRGMPDFQLSGEIIKDGLLNSHTIQSEGQRVFDSEIGLMMIGVEAYGGMSGGPVLVGDRVVGVFNGSLHEGRGIAWAIPTSYTNTLTPHSIGPHHFYKWPRFTMISGQWNDLRNWFIYKPDGVSEYQRYVQLLSEAPNVHDHWVSAYEKWRSLMERERTFRSSHYDLWVDNRRLSQKQQNSILNWWDMTRKAVIELDKTQEKANGLMNDTIQLGNGLLHTLAGLSISPKSGTALLSTALSLFYRDAAYCWRDLQSMEEQMAVVKRAMQRAQTELKKRPRGSKPRISAADDLFREFDSSIELRKGIYDATIGQGGCWETTMSTLNSTADVYEYTMFVEQ